MLLDFILPSTLALLSLVFVSLFWGEPIALSFIISINAFLLLFIDKRKAFVATFLFSAFLGSASEIFAVWFGAWTYSEPSFLTIPVWLPVLWGIAGVYASKVYVFFDGLSRGSKK